MKKLMILCLIHCGNAHFPSQIPMQCSTPYGELTTTVFVDNGNTISYSINDQSTYVLTRNAIYRDGVLSDGITTLSQTENGYSLQSTGVNCE